MITKFTKFASSAIVAGALALPSAASASMFLNDWYLDVDGDGDKVQVNEYLDFIGNSYIQLSPTGPNSFTFADNGFFRVVAADGGPGINDVSGAGRDLTALFSNGAGTGAFSGGINFTGGTLDLFSDVNFDYGSTTGLYGANNGTKIGSFSLTDGSGVVDADGVPNGQLTLIFQATELAAGYWFMPDGTTDMSTMVDQGLLFGFVTTNASFVAAPGTNLVNELGEMTGGPVINDPALGSFVVSNNGQYRLQTVPEPSVLALLGLGMLGACVGMRARRRS